MKSTLAQKNLKNKNFTLNDKKINTKFASTWTITTKEGQKSRYGVQSTLVNAIKNHLVYYPTPTNLFYV